MAWSSEGGAGSELIDGSRQQQRLGGETAPHKEMSLREPELL